ncbi:response regulator transcription factor [Brevundimonas diminuta]|uniref:response regulator transcription factor n=1 Tax=Brevundimonas diminuta TaxID=293 RepID=UPI0035D88EC4
MSDHSVFVIDDDSAVRDALLRVLRSRGVRARGFSSGTEFFAALPEDASACVITDVQMPGMDGTEIVRRLAELRGETWPVIVITGHADVSMAVQMMKNGIVDFIEKPFDPTRLVEVVNGCLARLGELDARQQARQQARVRLGRLTPRERQVFDALVAGASNKEMALNLKISPRTVEVFRAKVMTKMEADSLPALVRMGLMLS